MGRGRGSRQGGPAGRGLGRRFAGRGGGIGAGYGRQEYIAGSDGGTDDIDALRKEQDSLKKELARLGELLESTGEQAGE